MDFYHRYLALNVSSKVEDILYKVHSFLFDRNSSYWTNRLREAQSSPSTGLIVLENVTQPEFDALLSVLYSSCVPSEATLHTNVN